MGEHLKHIKCPVDYTSGRLYLRKDGSIRCHGCGREWGSLKLLNRARRHILSVGRTGKDKQLLPFSHKVMLGASGSGMGVGVNLGAEKERKRNDIGVKKMKTGEEIRKFIVKWHPTKLYDFVGSEGDHNTREIVDEHLAVAIEKMLYDMKHNYYG